MCLDNDSNINDNDCHFSAPISLLCCQSGPGFYFIRKRKHEGILSQQQVINPNSWWLLDVA